MSSIATHIKYKEKKTKIAPRPMTLERFHRLYDDREDEYKYEWHNGVVEKIPRTMNRSQLFIADNLSRFFTKTKAYTNGGGLREEVKMYLPTSNRTRIADMAYLNKEQLRETNNIAPGISEFVIEIISTNDKVNKVYDKLGQYFADGVKVVWQVFPEHHLVAVYTSPEDVKICKGTTICSAAPVVPDFLIAAEDVFK